MLGVKKLVNVGVAIEEQLRVGGEGCEEVWVLESEGSLHNPVNIVPDIVLALCTERYNKWPRLDIYIIKMTLYVEHLNSNRACHGSNKNFSFKNE